MEFFTLNGVNASMDAVSIERRRAGTLRAVR